MAGSRPFLAAVALAGAVFAGAAMPAPIRADMHWFLDPANREAAIDIVARAARQPRERFESYLYTKGDYYRDPNGRPNLQALQHDMATQRSLGFIKADLDVAKYTDLSFLDEAAKRLK
jgi:NitT/TauT family transport system substrate-binding protein